MEVLLTGEDFELIVNSLLATIEYRRTTENYWTLTSSGQRKSRKPRKR